MLGIALVHAVLMTIFVYDLVERQSHFLHQQSLDQARSLARSLAANSTSWVLSNDVIGLEEIIDSQSTYPTLEYAMVINPDGRVLGHTDTDKTGFYLIDNVSKRLQKSNSLQVLIDNNRLVDIAAPVITNGNLIGWARIGLSQERISEGLQIVTIKGLIYTFIAIAVGTLFAYLMARGLTGGLRQLLTIADGITHGQRHIRANIDRHDELGQLARDFNQMLDTLNENEFKIWLAQEKLAESEERFNLAMQGTNDGLWDWDINSHTVYYSPRWKQMLGYSEQEITESRDEWTDRVHPDDRPLVEQHVKDYLEGNIEHYEQTLRMRHRDGTYRWHMERGIAVRDNKSKAYRLVGTSTDITEEKEIERQLFDEKERAMVTLHSIGDGVITTDEKGKINFMNPVAESVIAYATQDVLGKQLDEIITLKNEDTGDPVENPIRRCLEQGVVVDLEPDTLLINHREIGHAIEDSAAPIRDQEGRLIGAIMVFHDVAVTRQLTREMTWQASHDVLTGLINRSELENRLKKSLDSAHQDNEVHTFLYLDLDQFKVVNDTSGHIAGDELLKQLAFLLQKQVRESDTLARLGGDEFGVLLNRCNTDRALKIANKLRDAVNDFRFVWKDKAFDTGVSIGVIEINSKSHDIAGILSSADIACYAAKDLGRNRIHVYQPDDEELSQRHHEMQWVTHIKKALEEDRFILYAQSIVPVSPDSPYREHKEVLVRMLDQNNNIVPPFTFIPAAERYNLMPAIDKWVIDNAFFYLQKNPISITINISGNSLGDNDFLSHVKHKLHEYQIEPSNICFEITETSAITHLTTAERFIRELKKLGCRFALDDFGSGLSSFTYLKNLSVDYLKIDGSFVKDINDNPIDYVMVKAINEVGHAMGIMTIAEFVENEEILKTLRTIGVDFAQGYGIDRPSPLIG
ncbi:MAG: EAL domain-containing protein [Thiohalophilus sp.]|uniref:EAL domain-containing protein n=1 Tax=Thiohalophilus sp. TaxID=3028392 RepID=UPI0028700E23|nr:EAL domain-containing protein [Thiohalophilus sp.]MDR9435264.1 EAL domain-containing protein [Thiohalophilus sp.]